VADGPGLVSAGLKAGEGITDSELVSVEACDPTEDIAGEGRVEPAEAVTFVRVMTLVQEESKSNTKTRKTRNL